MSFELKIKLKLPYSAKRRRSQTPQNDTVSHQTTPSYSAETVGGNDDLLNEILLRLPIKPLLKFKSVSKRFLSLISNPTFSRLRSPSPATSSGLFLRRPWSASVNPEFHFVDFDHPCRNRNPSSSSSSSKGAPFRSLNFVNERYGITVSQSCNGLLLCSSCRAPWSRKTYYVYNPTTKQYTTLPPLPSRGGGGGGGTLRAVNDVVLAFDPSKSPHYKVVCVVSWKKDGVLGDQYQIAVYSSEGGPWRLYGGLAPPSSDILFGLVRGVFWNGAVRWFSGFGTSIFFNVEEERLCEMPLALSVRDYFDDVNSGRVFKYFGESRDHLHKVEYVTEPGELATHCLNVFELEKDCARWVLKSKVDLVEISNVFPEFQDYRFYVLCVVRGELDEDSFLVLNIPGKVLRCDFKSNTFYTLFDIEGSDHVLDRVFFYPDEVYQYIESLACV